MNGNLGGFAGILGRKVWEPAYWYDRMLLVSIMVVDELCATPLNAGLPALREPGICPCSFRRFVIAGKKGHKDH